MEQRFKLKKTHKNIKRKHGRFCSDNIQMGKDFIFLNTTESPESIYKKKADMYDIIKLKFSALQKLL